MQNNKIGYKMLDSISFTSSYGYRTMFAYIYESQPERGNIKVSSAKLKYKIDLRCGNYSYA